MISDIYIQTIFIFALYVNIVKNNNYLFRWNLFFFDSTKNTKNSMNGPNFLIKGKKLLRGESFSLK